MTAGTAPARDSSIDTMRGIGILMVIGIHSLHQPLTPAWETWLDAAMRPCVPIFLFASGYLTALSGRVPLTRRFVALLIPYAIAFAAAYLYMALHNPAMDHRLVATAARFVLAYVFVYYYVFVYAGCTLLLWLLFKAARGDPVRLAILLLIAIGVSLIAGAYLDPLLMRLHATESLIQEVRMRDIPFWFGFAALGALAGMAGVRDAIRSMRVPLIAVMLVLYVLRLGALVAGRRCRRLRFRRILRLRRVALRRAVWARPARGVSRRAGFGQLFYLSLAHLCRDGAARPRGPAPARAVGRLGNHRRRHHFCQCRRVAGDPKMGAAARRDLARSLTMLLRQTLLYLPAQIIGPLFQLVAMIVWTHVVDEHTLRRHHAGHRHP